MKSKNPSPPRRRRGPVLAGDACPTCGAMMVERRGRLRLRVNGEEITVPSTRHLRCPKCDEVVLRFEDSRRLSTDAIAIYSKKHHLLSADEIRSLRERFGLKQADLAGLLRLGANTISRWESGRNVQTALMDVADEDEARGLAGLRRAFAHSACASALSGRDSSATKLPTSLAVAASSCTGRIFWCFATTLFGRPTRNGTPRHGAAL
jgi:putative zinc finger/helix-turn-helix YgiT family protein